MTSRCRVWMVLAGTAIAIGSLFLAPSATHVAAVTVHHGEYNSSVIYGAQLHVFEYQFTDEVLEHIWWDGTRWQSEKLDGPGVVGGNGRTTDHVGSHNSAVVYNGQLHDFYYDLTSHTLRHAWWDGTSWHFETLDGAGSPYSGASTDRIGTNNSAVVYNGQLQDFYYDDCPSACGSTTAALRHAWWNGTSWHLETLDGTGSLYSGASTDWLGEFSSAVVYNGQLQNFYWDFATPGGASATNVLRHAWFNGTGWHLETLDGAGSLYSGASTDRLGDFNSAVVYNGQLQDFYYDSCTSACGPTTAVLRHAWWNGTSWHLETLDGAGSPHSGGSTDLLGESSSAVVYNGQLQNFYYDLTSHTLRHAWWDGTTWHLETLDGAGSPYSGASTDRLGEYNSAVVYNGQLQNFYFDFSTGGGGSITDVLRHAWWNGTAWGFEFLP